MTTDTECLHVDDSCTHKSATGRAIRAARIAGGTGQVAVRESGTVVSSRRPELDGEAELGYARKFLGYFGIYPSEAVLDTLTLWAAHAHARDAGGMLVFPSTPRLMLLSSEPGSGKSHVLRLLSKITPQGRVFLEPSEAALAHSIGKEHRTVFLDESDVLFGQGQRKSAIRAIVNDGYTPDGSWTRVRSGKVESLPTFGALAIAGLDVLETGTGSHLKALLDRGIRVRMARGPEGYRPPRFDRDAAFVAARISERLTLWASQVIGELEDAVPEVPEGIGNRPAELWEPLLAVADAAGGRWPEAARQACEELVFTGGMPDEAAETADEMDRIMAAWDAEL